MEEVFGKADALEKKYDWVEAADLYKQALREVGKKDFSRRGEIQERIGYCLYRAAFQAETQEGFKNRIKSAIEAFEKASESFDNVEDLEKLTRARHCKAMAAYTNSWISPDASRKKELLDDCWRLEQKAIATYEGAGDQANAGKVCNSLMACLIDRLNLEWDADARERIVEDALEYGERAMKFFSKSEDKHQRAQTYVLKAFFP